MSGERTHLFGRQLADEHKRHGPEPDRKADDERDDARRRDGKVLGVDRPPEDGRRERHGRERDEEEGATPETLQGSLVAQSTGLLA